MQLIQPANVFSLIEAGLLKRGDRAALDYENKTLTGLETLELISELKDFFAIHGLQKGDRVLLVNDGDLYFLLFYHAIISSGGIVVPCPSGENIMVGERFLRNVVKPSFVISQKSVLNDCCYNILNTPFLLEKLNVGDDQYKESLTSLNVASIMYTSGTTGLPKGVLVTHENLVSTILKNIEFQQLSQTTVELNSLPLTHSFGLGQFNATLAAGGYSKIVPGLANIGRFFRAAKQNEVTTLPLTPLGLEILTGRYAQVFKEYFSNLQTVMVNSAPLPPRTSRRVKSLCPNIRLLVYYGLTEASRSTFSELNETDENGLTNVGKPLGDTEIKLDEETCEIVISGSNVSPGYFIKNGQEIVKHIDGALRTGDKGRYDEQGRLVIVGRIFDEINFGGFKIDPLEVERIALGFLGVSAACLVLDDGKERFETTVMLIVGEQEINKNDLIKYLRDRLEHYKVPHKVLQVSKIPMGESGKLNRIDAKALIESL